MPKLIINDVEFSGTGATTAKQLSYDNNNSGLVATNTQEAIDELDVKIDTQHTQIEEHDIKIAENASNITNNTTAIDELNSDLTSATTYSGNKFSSITKSTLLNASNCMGVLEKYGRVVHCAFSINTNSEIPAGTTIMTLPNGYKPKYHFYFSGCQSGSGNSSNFGIGTDGKISSTNSPLMANAYFVASITFIS